MWRLRVRVALAGAAYDLYAKLTKRLKLFSAQEFVGALSNSPPKLTHDELETCLEEYVRDTVIIEQPGGELAFFDLSTHE